MFFCPCNESFDARRGDKPGLWSFADTCWGFRLLWRFVYLELSEPLFVSSVDMNSHQLLEYDIELNHINLSLNNHNYRHLDESIQELLNQTEFASHIMSKRLSKHLKPETLLSSKIVPISLSRRLLDAMKYLLPQIQLHSVSNCTSIAILPIQPRCSTNEASFSPPPKEVS